MYIKLVENNILCTKQCVLTRRDRNKQLRSLSRINRTDDEFLE